MYIHTSSNCVAIQWILCIFRIIFGWKENGLVSGGGGADFSWSKHAKMKKIYQMTKNYTKRT
jgi:hypothetical protein